MASTSSLAKDIESDHLTCGVCRGPYKDPRVLPNCQHGFCCECLERAVESSNNKQRLTCPMCRKVTKMPRGGGVKDLPVHFLANSLKDKVEKEKALKRRNTNTVCSNCESNKAAKVRCMDCLEYLCDTCHTAHRRLKTMRDHRVLSMKDILSGKVPLLNEESTICEDHREPHRYYCKNEKRAVCQGCVTINKCPPEHDRITIDEAVQEKSEDLEYLVKKSYDVLKKYQDSIKEVDDIEKKLETNSKRAKVELDKLEKKYIKLVQQNVKRFKDEINEIEEQNMKELDKKKTDFKSVTANIEMANENITRIIESRHKMRLISSHSTLSTELQTLSESQPDEVDKALGYVKFEAAIPSSLNIGRLLKREPLWNLTGQFSTADFDDLKGLALDQDDNIVVSSWEKGVKVFTRNGEVKSTLYNSPGSPSVGVLPGKKYVTTPLNKTQIKICDSQGNQVQICPITDVKNAPSNVNSVSVDCDNKIIVGQVANTISIHNTDGSLISKHAKFPTQSEPFRLAATSNGDIVSSFYDRELKRGTSVQLMDYSGGNVRVIQPPDEVKVWSPSFVCCGQGEIFVSNAGPGDPPGVYRFTSEGDYLGCVTTQVRNPRGIALSRDGMELFVADYGDSHVKIFQRP